MVHRSNSNRLLSTLGEKELQQFQGALESVLLMPEQILFTPDYPIEFVYFPLTGLVSFSARLEDGRQNEIGLAGREGFVCAAAILGAETASVVGKVEIAGTATKMSIGAFRDLMNGNAPFRSVLFQYALEMAGQLKQMVLCGRHHKLTQRLARLLLTVHDRVEGDQLPLTHDALALMLGAHRPAVSTAVLTLQRLGAIHSHHRLMIITDRAGLEAASCECYQALKIRHMPAQVH